MFFTTLWQGIVFGIITSVGMLAICYALAMGWKKYEGNVNNKNDSCNVHH